jgi:hypothetical protein
VPFPLLLSFFLFSFFYFIIETNGKSIAKRVTFNLEATVPQVSALRQKIHHVGSAVL